MFEGFGVTEMQGVEEWREMAPERVEEEGVRGHEMVRVEGAWDEIGT